MERCAFGAITAWTAYAIASNEIASRHRVNFDATVTALAQTAKDMNSKYKETSQAGRALSVVLCSSTELLVKLSFGRVRRGARRFLRRSVAKRQESSGALVRVA